MGLHVAGRAGIGVVAPGSADLVVLLQDKEVADAGLEQFHAHAQPAEPGADDGHLEFARRRRVVHVGRCTGSDPARNPFVPDDELTQATR